MDSPRSLLCLAAFALATCLAASGASAAPIITTFAQSSVGPVTDSDGPQAGGALTSQVTTTGASSLCSFQGACAPGQLTAGHATASQNETLFGIFSALEADGTFFVGGQSANNSLLSRTTWQDSPSAAGPTSITLLIKPGELILSDFASVVFGSATRARFRIELSVNGSVFFFSEAMLQGGVFGGPTLTETGTDLGGTPVIDPDYPNNVFGYRFDPLLTTIALGNLSPTDVVLYTMEVSVHGPGLETGARAQIGDPFDLANGGSSIAFSTPVPEPSAALLLGVAGLLGLAWCGRRPARLRRGARAALVAAAALTVVSSAASAVPVVTVRSNGNSLQDASFVTHSGSNFSGIVDLSAGTFALHSDSVGFANTRSDASLATLVFSNDTSNSIALPAGAVSLYIFGSYALDPCSGCGVMNNNATVVTGGGQLSVRVHHGMTFLDHNAIAQHTLSRLWDASGGVASETNTFTPFSVGGASVVVTSATFGALVVELATGPIVLDPGDRMSILVAAIVANSNGGDATFTAMGASLSLTLPAGVTLTNDAGVPLAWLSVPEPSVALLLGIAGAFALAIWREREKHRARKN